MVLAAGPIELMLASGDRLHIPADAATLRLVLGVFETERDLPAGECSRVLVHVAVRYAPWLRRPARSTHPSRCTVRSVLVIAKRFEWQRQERGLLFSEHGGDLRLVVP